MKKAINSLTILTFSAIVLLSGCMPRGETKSAEEVFQAARDRFSAAQRLVPADAMNAEAQRSIEQVSAALNKWVGGATVMDKANEARAIEEALGALIPYAGYTSRAALAEVQKQYAELAESLGSNNGATLPTIEASTVKLAASRAYSILASELETTKFGVQ